VDVDLLALNGFFWFIYYLFIVYLPFHAGGGFKLTTKVAVLLNQCVTQTKPFYHISVVIDCRYLLPLLDCIILITNECSIWFASLYLWNQLPPFHHLILFTLLFHLILHTSPHHNPCFYSYHLSLRQPFTSDLKFICFINPFLRSFYRTMHFSAKRGIAIACCLSLRLSVCDVGELWSHRLEFFENNFTIS